MAYQKLYYFDFYRLRTTEKHTIEIWKNSTDVITAEEITGSSSPFVVELPELDHKFQVVRGTGCTLSIISDTDQRFFNSLYHVDYKELIIKHYIAGTLNWIGYLDSEMYSEKFDEVKNYVVSVNGNDGFALMDRFAFIGDDEIRFSGTKSKIEILKICFDKIALPWTLFKIFLSTTFTGYSNSATSSILHESYINCENFYDEDLKPMKIREVIESVLAPYGAYIFSVGDSIYITDINAMANNTSITFKSFDYSTLAFSSNVAVTIRKSTATIGRFGTGSNIEISGGKNRQEVVYSPYPITDIVETSFNSLDEFSSVPASYSVRDEYYYRRLGDNRYWIKQPLFTFFEQGYYDDPNNTNIYFLSPRSLTNSVVLSLNLDTYYNITGIKEKVVDGITIIDGLNLFISGQMLVQTKLNPFRTGVELQLLIKALGIRMRVSIGDYYFDFATKTWGTTVSDFYFYTYNSDDSIIADQFIQMGIDGAGLTIPIGNLSSEIVFNGKILVEFMSDTKSKSIHDANYITNKSGVMAYWLKDLSVKFIKYDGSEITNLDITYIGILNKLFANEAEQIKLTCGTDSQYSDRGKIMYKDGDTYKSVLEWTRNSQTFCIEKLLLASLSSNYQAGYLTLSSMKLKSAFNQLNVITDAFISGKNMMIKSLKQDFWNNTNECDLIEILPDSLTIVEDNTLT